MLVGDYVGGSEEPTEEDCCSRCDNTPSCSVWSYCPLEPSDR